MKYTVPSNTNKIDGIERGIKPGDVIVLDAKNTYSQPPHFTNLSGVTVTTVGKIELAMASGFAYVVKFGRCSKIKMTGDFHLSGGNKDSIGISVEDRSTDIEIEGVHIHSTGFAAIMAKDNGAAKGTFTMRNIKIHHCQIENTGGEGLYIGNSSFSGHALENVSIYKNHIEKSGWDGIQLGCTTNGQIYENEIIDCGTKDKPGQRNGIQVGEGTKALVYRNLVRNARGNGVIVLGTGSHIYDNKLFECGEAGIFSDAREGTVEAHKFTKNEIILPKSFGIADRNKKFPSVVKNNLILNPGIRFFENGPEIDPSDNNNFKEMNMPLAEFYLKKG